MKTPATTDSSTSWMGTLSHSLSYSEEIELTKCIIPPRNTQALIEQLRPSKCSGFRNWIFNIRSLPMAYSGCLTFALPKPHASLQSLHFSCYTLHLLPSNWVLNRVDFFNERLDSRLLAPPGPGRTEAHRWPGPLPCRTAPTAPASNRQMHVPIRALSSDGKDERKGFKNTIPTHFTLRPGLAMGGELRQVRVGEVPNGPTRHDAACSVG